MPSALCYHSRRLVPVFVLCVWLVHASRAVTDKRFKHDYHAENEESGEAFRLRSEGTLTDFVELDLISAIKHVACVEDRLMILMYDVTVARTWRPGQVVVGGPQWGCNATLDKPKGSGIYVKIRSVYFPLDGQVTVHHRPAGPFDMIEEADIHFHYQPPKKKYKNASTQGDSTRLRRALPNLVSNILDNVDWHANFTADIPFRIGDPSDDLVQSDPGYSGQRLVLHKQLGQSQLGVSRGQRASNQGDDFVLDLDRLKGHTQLAYTFNLVIKNTDGIPAVAHYESQYDLKSELRADSTVTFSREVGLTYLNVSIFNTPDTELFRVPVASVRGVPPVFLTVGYRAETIATVKAYSGGPASLRTAFSASGSATISHHRAGPSTEGGDVSSRDWLIEPQEHSHRSPFACHLGFSVHQKLYFTPAVSWHFHDVDIELSPPAEVSIRPVIRLMSSSPGVAQCVEGDVRVDAHVAVHNAYFTADAFGLSLWNILLGPSMMYDLHLVNLSLGKECEAQCQGSQQPPLGLLKTALSQSAAFTREDLQFKSLTTLKGDAIMVQDTSNGATWCGHQNMSCYPCDSNSTNSEPKRSCAARLMTSRMAAVLTLLSDYVSVEWPDKQLLVLESWDEPTSVFPSGRHGPSSIFAQGRATFVTLIEKNPAPLSATQNVPTFPQLTSLLPRLAKLAVCAGADDVQQAINGNKLEIAVDDNGVERNSTGSTSTERQITFMKNLETLDLGDLAQNCLQAPRLSPGNQWPQGVSLEEECGPPDRPLSRANRKHMKQLVHWNLTSTSVTFEPEGPSWNWCGYSTRQCHSCIQSSVSIEVEAWDWCSTRMMTPRLLMRLWKLQKIAEKQNISLHVLQSFQEPTEKNVNVLPSLFSEGRGIRLSTYPTGKEILLASLAVCAGFDFVSFAHPTYIEAFVKKQSGFQASLVSFPEGPLRPVILPNEPDIAEYAYPDELAEEDDLPELVDGGFAWTVPISEHVHMKDIMSPDRRYFRLDPVLLECLELVTINYPGKFEIVQGSAYRTRSANFLENIDQRHTQEKWRFQAGQAVELRPIPLSEPQDLLTLATSLLRECPPLVRLGMRGMGLGCHSSHLYVDFRPLIPGFERYYVTVWDADNTTYSQDVRKLQKEMIEGGPVVQAMPNIACKDRGLSSELEFLSFQFGQNVHCTADGQEEFCTASHEAREKVADSLQTLLTSAAGLGRLPRFELIGEIRACLVDICGGCPGSGQVFEAKVSACSQLVHKYVQRAASPFPELTDVATFFNTGTAVSTVQAMACHNGSVCIEDTPLYSLFEPTVTARYYPDPSKSLEKSLFSSDINPTPLLEIISQEMAYAAKGQVRVFIEAETDIYALRNVLKVLMVYNKNITMVQFLLASGPDPDSVTSSIQRKLEAWAAVACPLYSRFAMSPFTVITMEPEHHKRSADLSMPRNKARSRMYNWEIEWLEKMY